MIILREPTTFDLLVAPGDKGRVAEQSKKVKLDERKIYYDSQAWVETSLRSE